MSVDPGDFLVSAVAMLQPESSEIDFRNAASRAYYAAYHAARALAVTLPVQAVVKGGAHEQVIKTLTDGGTSHFSMQCRRVGYLLSTMRTARHRADYELGTDFLRTDAESLISSVPNLHGAVAQAKAAQA